MSSVDPQDILSFGNRVPTDTVRMRSRHPPLVRGEGGQIPSASEAGGYSPGEARGESLLV